MTAMNLIVRPEAAYLLTDTACYSSNGIVTEFMPKVVELHVGQRVPIAFSSTGMALWSHFTPRLHLLNARCAGDVLVALPGMFRAVEQDLLAVGKDKACGDAHMSIAVAAWDHATSRPAGFVMSNDNRLFPADVYRPYSLLAVDKYLTDFGDARPFAEGVDPCNPRAWDPYRDSEALIEAQRADPFGDEGATFLAIGGQAVLTRVDATGVKYHLVKCWPDKKGRRIAA